MELLTTIDDVAKQCQLMDSSQKKATLKKLLEDFIGANFCGSRENLEVKFVDEKSAKEGLSYGLNKPCVAIKAAWTLYVVRTYLMDLGEEENLLLLEFYLLWQQSLQDKSPEIKESAELLVPSIEASLEKMTSSEAARTLLKLANFYYQFYEYDKVFSYVEKATKLSGLDVDLTGIMGKRTRFQHNSIAQLVLVHNENSFDQNIQEVEEDVPTNCALNDDTLLEKVALTETSERLQVDGKKLTNEQLACLLWLARHERMANRADPLVREKCQPIIEPVLSARRCWPTQAAALLLRSELEKDKGRMVERSCSQAELVSKLMVGVDDTASAEQRRRRIDYVLESGLQPSWQVAVFHTEVLRSLGCTGEALLILEKLELWEGVIDCYKSLGQLEKAESLIRRLLEEKPDDSMLYVYLGDITQATEYYYKAIEISNDRNARAHKALGHLFLMQKKFAEAYKHLRRSLELQPIQLGTWFNAGYCAWKLENYEDSCKCYHRCVCLQPDHFEAWSNLSSAYIRAGQKEKAWKLLQEALKFNYEHPKVWENYMLLSVDTGAWQQAISAYHRLIDLNLKETDEQVLTILGTGILGKLEQTQLTSEETAELKKEKTEMIKLLSRITTSQTLTAKLWRLYAELKKPDELTKETRTEFEKFVQLLEKSLAAGNSKQNWSKNESETVQVLDTAITLAEERLKLARFVASETSENEAKAKCRLSLRNIVSRAEKDSAERICADEHKIPAMISTAKSLLAQCSS